jgi:hypothetical protein
MAYKRPIPRKNPPATLNRKRPQVFPPSQHSVETFEIPRRGPDCTTCKRGTRRTLFWRFIGQSVFRVYWTGERNTPLLNHHRGWFGWFDKLHGFSLAEKMKNRCWF